MDFQGWLVPVLSVASAVAAALIIGRFLAPSLESRKVAAVAASEEAETFAQHLHLMAVDFRLASQYEAKVRGGINANENSGKVSGMLEGVVRRAAKAGKIARAGKRVRFSEERRQFASVMIGLVLTFSGEHYPRIRKGQAYFNRVAEDRYLADMADLLDFASKVFQPRRFAWFPLRRLDRRMKTFIGSMRDDLGQAQMAYLHELGLEIADQAGDGTLAQGDDPHRQEPI